MDDELERKWKEVAEAYFNILSLHSPGKTEQKTKMSVRIGKSSLRFEQGPS
jgi:hypothetical protein